MVPASSKILKLMLVSARFEAETSNLIICQLKGLINHCVIKLFGANIQFTM